MDALIDLSFWQLFILLVAALVAGVVGGLSGFGGGLVLPPVLAPILGAKSITGQAYLATDAALSTALNITKSLAFSQQGMLDPNTMIIGLMLGIASIPGNYLGRILLYKTSTQNHTRMIEVLIMIGGITLLIPPIMNLLQTL